MTSWVLAGGIAIFVLLAVMIVRWRCHARGERLIGPLLPYELIRLARRGLQPRLRAVLVGFLLVGLLVVYVHTFPYLDSSDLLDGSTAVTRNKMSEFGETFLIMFLIVQLLAVILIAPVYAAGSISEEKDRNTLEFLQTSLLTSREIVLGKLCARLGYVFAIILAGLPVLMLTSLFGGVDPERLLIGYGIAAVAAVHLSSFAMLMAAYCRSLRVALFWTYFLLIGTALVGSIFGCFPGVAAISAPSMLGYYFISWYEDLSSREFVLQIVGGFAITQVFLSVIFLLYTVRGLRHEPLMGTKTQTPTPEPRPERRAISPVFDDPPSATVRSFSVLRLGPDENSVVWRERYFQPMVSRLGRDLQGCLGICLILLMVPFTAVLFICLVVEFTEHQWIDGTVNITVRVIMEAFLLVLPFWIGLRTVGTIGRERQQQTLLTLLTLPWSRAEILAAKWQGSVYTAKKPLLTVAITLAVGVVLVSVHPFGAIGAAVLFFGFCAFCSALGLFLSVTIPTTTRATIAYIIGWMLAFAGPLVLALFSSVFIQSPRDRLGELLVSFSPPVGIWTSLFPWNIIRDAQLETVRGEWSAAIALVSGTVFWVIAGLLWNLSVRRFDREGEDGK